MSGRHRDRAAKGIVLAVLGFVLLMAVLAVAQTPAPPTLTEVQRLTVTGLLQRIEIAQLKAQIAQREFDAARAELTTVAKGLEVAGYELDLGALRYRAIIQK